MTKKAMVFGVSGQDGAYLAKHLLEKSYAVTGVSRDAANNSFSNLKALGIINSVTLETVSLGDFRGVVALLQRTQPNEIYNLAGQSSVGLSFAKPMETYESISTATLHVLEAIRVLEMPVRYYNASSGECFGDTGEMAAEETSHFMPQSPYAVAKAAAHWLVGSYRDAYKIFACNGILFNHESPLRPQRFVTRKIVCVAKRIADGAHEKLYLGNIDIFRDWGWAPEYVDAMWRMLQQDEPEDYIIATGQTYSLREFVEEAFGILGLDWKDHVEVKSELFRPTDIQAIRANPAKAQRKLGWKAKYAMRDVVRMMLEAERGEHVAC